MTEIIKYLSIKNLKKGTLNKIKVIRLPAQ